MHDPFLRTTLKEQGIWVGVGTYMYEEESDVNSIERTRLPWQWISQDIELLELKIGGDWAIVGVVKWVEHGKESFLIG
jgi:hypothetical protein